MWLQGLDEKACEKAGRLTYLRLGYQPYWDWTKSINDISAYPLFDGSEYSISGNGVYDNSSGAYDVGPYVFAHGTGGGCVQSGPFKDLQLHLGPVPFHALDIQQLPSNWTVRNNRCLERDFNVPVAQHYSNSTSVAYLLAAPTIAEFQSRMSGVGTRPPGPHTAGHLQIGAEMFDLFTSPNDPAFFFHHANVDRMWTIWQNRDLKERQYALNGTVLNYDPPTAPLLTLDTVVNWGVLGRAKRFKELMSNLKGDFNYVYEDMGG
jgi:tyrosinase